MPTPRTSKRRKLSDHPEPSATPSSASKPQSSSQGHTSLVATRRQTRQSQAATSSPLPISRPHQSTTPTSTPRRGGRSNRQNAKRGDTRPKERRRNNLTDDTASGDLSPQASPLKHTRSGNNPPTGQLSDSKPDPLHPQDPDSPALAPSHQQPKPCSSTSTHTLRTISLRKLTSQTATPHPHHDPQRQKIHHLLAQTVLSGEGNSCLLIGPRGSGKTALVEDVLRELGNDHRDEFHVIRLDGFIQTDDRTALREIWRQLGREMDIADESNADGVDADAPPQTQTPVKNYADALAMLLALLSHPYDLASDPDAEASTEHKAARSLIFTLSEFDLFASHTRQTLLYNLFDAAQAQRAPIAVLGLTTRVDAADMLEKRVKSRFSHRFVQLGPPRSLDAFLQCCRSACRVTPPEIPPASRTTVQETDITAWNSAADALLASPAHGNTLRHIYHTTKSLPEAHTSLYMPVAQMDPSGTDPHIRAKQTPTPLLHPDSKLQHLPSLTALALGLLIAAARLTITLDADTLTFPLAYGEYCSLMGRSRGKAGVSSSAAVGGGRVWSREVARGAWEELVRAELVMPEGGAGGGGGGVTALAGGDHALYRVDVALEEVEGAATGAGAYCEDGEARTAWEGGMEGWCREL